MKKRTLSLILTLAMVLACMTIIAHAQTSGTCGADGDNLTWTLDSEGTLTISGTGEMADYTSNNNHAPWHNSCSNITNIIIEEGVTKIGEEAFTCCKGIDEVTIPAGVKEIGKSAFELCTNLKSINLPDSVEKIGDEAFEFCQSLTTVSIPASVKSVGECVFSYCTNLSAVEVDANNENYMSEEGVLYNKDKTKIIRYPNKKSGAAYVIPDGVTSIETDAFEGSEALESIDIPESVKEIGAYAFEYCINLTSLTIPEGVKVINYGTVLDCEKLASVNIPESVISIAFGVFDGTAYYNDESNWEDGVLYIDNCLIEAKSSLSGDYQIKDGTRVIAAAAMYSYNGVTGISIPESVINIGLVAFSGTAFYKDNSNWDNGVLYIDNCLIKTKSDVSGEYRVKDETRLIAEGAVSVGDYTEIAIPKSVKHINDGAFRRYTYTSELDIIFEAPIAPMLGIDVFSDKCDIHIHEGYTDYTEENGYPADKIVVEPHSYENGVCTVCGIGSGTCGDNLTWTLDSEGTLTISGTGDMTDYTYDTHAPWYDSRLNITNIIIENGVTGIGDYAFDGCKSIEELAIPQSVKEIGKSAFVRCTNLKNLNMSDGVEKIGEDAFAYCNGLATVSIPSSVTGMDDCVFAHCRNLTSVDVDANNARYMSEDGVLYSKDKTEIILYPNKKNGTSYVIPDGVTSIAIGAFEACEALESIDIPESVREIGHWAFEGCINLTSLKIPEGVTLINADMVKDCEKLVSINIPESVNSIAWGVFDGTAYYNDESNWTDGALYIDNCLIDTDRSLSGDYQVKDGTRIIAAGAMYYDNGVTGISIPETVVNIGLAAFDGTEFYKDKSNWMDNALYIDNCLIEIKSNELSGKYHVKDGTRLIAEGAFGGGYGITGVTIPKSVKYINGEAFNTYTYEPIDFVFEAPIAPILGVSALVNEAVFPEKFNIHIHEGYTGYTEENGYPEDKIVVEPHSYENGVCSVCGARETVSSVERIDGDGNANYIFRVNLGQEHENSYVYAAVYDAGGVLVSINRVPLETTGDTVISLDKSENAMTAKVFVWANELQPILETAAEFTLTN